VRAAAGQGAAARAACVTFVPFDHTPRIKAGVGEDWARMPGGPGISVARPVPLSIVRLVGRDHEKWHSGGMVSPYPTGWLCAAIRVDQPVPDRVGDDLGAVVEMKLVENVAEVILDGVFADEQLFGQLAVRGYPADE